MKYSPVLKGADTLLMLIGLFAIPAEVFGKTNSSGDLHRMNLFALFLNGQFTPASPGQFGPARHGQLKPANSGQFHRRIHFHKQNF
ncbi:hypothetical protein [Paracnuella aquatica]|uniref:hypothetical protein n=1 Tax=Paracnuella aquatica TaxID=2268757 RepID=UPI000DEF6ADB|nr:hypothetical protein [Paracnuella aquatica]RPD46486.1 hypothetical protein DRJ53_13680 [Paracnuella aquatica]